MAEVYDAVTRGLIKEINSMFEYIIAKRPAADLKGRSMPNSTTQILVRLAKEKGYSQYDLKIIEEMGKGNKF